MLGHLEAVTNAPAGRRATSCRASPSSAP